VGPSPRESAKANNVEIDGTDRASHKEQASMIRR
jgi:hypothetical protein